MSDVKVIFGDFFQRATGFREPYPYQIGLACAQKLPHLMDIPTGLGKTAAVVLAWLFRRRFHPDEAVRKSTPRRLIYCLPMRTLVEQTEGSVCTWLGNLNLKGDIGLHVLMGGEKTDDWDLYPERDAILIGTQDMLLSRALNRGYGMSRFRWPMHLALLNNDCLWVFDEVQLMDSGVATTAQLKAFQQIYGTLFPVHSIWMSATLNPEWLNTVDFGLDWLNAPYALTEEDLQRKEVKNRYEAAKSVERTDAEMGDAGTAAESILAAHAEAPRGTRTLAVFNTVRRAVDVYRELSKRKPEAKIVLIHSRFRLREREEKTQELLKPPPEEGVIAVTTQVVEAGVDISARLLFTELAPWSSLVQRFGRCNRSGEFNETNSARVYWFDLPGLGEKEQEELANPYELNELCEARKLLEKLLESFHNADPKSLKEIPADMRLEPAHVIRRRDFIDLFDTTPDLAGNDVDVSRFIRSGEEFDVQVFWRDVPKDAKLPDPQQAHGKAPHRGELCSVPVYEFRDFVGKKQRLVWRWDALEQQWSPARQDDVFPGQTFLVRIDAGGYDSNIGWDSGSKKTVEPVFGEGDDEQEAYDHDLASVSLSWQTVAPHTDDVVRELEAILKEMPLEDSLTEALNDAARWHDFGKAHEIFQKAVRRDERPAGFVDRVDIAKAPKPFWKRYERPHFRHELASALAMIQMEKRDLSIYLVAAHHGKVRLSIRSLPGEKSPEGDPARLYARGVWDGDALPEVDLGGGVTAPPVTLSLDCMQLGRSKEGRPSWVERMLKLRDDPKIGPFRLAFLEALLRAADMRASRTAGTTEATR